MNNERNSVNLECGPFFPTIGKSAPLASNAHTPSRPHPLTPTLSTHHTPTLSPSPRRGFTLIEVMLSIAILGIGAGILMVATSRCMAVATRAKHYGRAHRLIQQVEAAHPLTRGEIEEGTESGTLDDGYTWEREITESETEGREGLYTIRTRVSWAIRGKQSYEETVALHYIRPTEAELDEARSSR